MSVQQEGISGIIIAIAGSIDHKLEPKNGSFKNKYLSVK